MACNSEPKITAEIGIIESNKPVLIKSAGFKKILEKYINKNLIPNEKVLKKMFNDLIKRSSCMRSLNREAIIYNYVMTI